MAIKYNISAVSGHVAGASGSTVNGTGLHMGAPGKGVKDLSALVTVVVTTGSLTFTPKWQVSNDNSTYVDATPENNAANVAISASASKAISAPAAARGWKWARLALTVGGATGATADTYAISYCCRMNE